MIAEESYSCIYFCKEIERPKKEYTTKIKYPQIAGNPHPHLMGWWNVILIYDSPEKDWQIGEKKFYEPLEKPRRVKTWSTSKVEFV